MLWSQHLDWDQKFWIKIGDSLTKNDYSTKMRKFSKVAFLQTNGLMHRRYNYETHQFDFSAYLLVNSYVTLLVKVSFPLKLFVSMFWERKDVAQLWIGLEIMFQIFTCSNFNPNSFLLPQEYLQVIWSLNLPIFHFGSFPPLTVFLCSYLEDEPRYMMAYIGVILQSKNREITKIWICLLTFVTGDREQLARLHSRSIQSHPFEKRLSSDSKVDEAHVWNSGQKWEGIPHRWFIEEKDERVLWKRG